MVLYLEISRHTRKEELVLRFLQISLRSVEGSRPGTTFSGTVHRQLPFDKGITPQSDNQDRGMGEGWTLVGAVTTPGNRSRQESRSNTQEPPGRV